MVTVTEELGNVSKQVPKANNSKMPEIRLSITEQSGPLEVFVEEDEEEEEELDDSLGGNTIEIAKAITIKAPTPEKEGRETQIENSTSQTFVTEDKDKKEAGDKDASLEAEREMQAAEFDALASIENPAPNVPETTGDILKRLGQGKAMTYKQALKEILSGKDQLEANRSNIVTEAKPTYLKKRSGFMGVFGPKKPKKLNPKLIDERDNVFLMAQLKFDADNETHVSILQAVYRRLTGSNRNIPLIARMWMDIGFQTQNPQTDIRGTGVFGLLQMLGFVESHFDLVYKIHQLSLTETNSFPLMATAFNVSSKCLSALRQGALNKVANDNESVYERSVQDFYESAFYAFYSEFRKKQYTDKIDSIRNFQPIFQDAMLTSTRKPIEAMNTLAKYLIGQKKQQEQQEMQFTNMKEEVKKVKTTKMQ